MAKKAEIEEIEKLVFQLKGKCKAAKIPMFISVCTSDPVIETNTEVYEIKQPKYIIDFVTPYYCNLKLTPDYIADGIKAMNGFGDIKRKDIIDLGDLDFSIPNSFN